MGEKDKSKDKKKKSKEKDKTKDKSKAKDKSKDKDKKKDKAKSKDKDKKKESKKKGSTKVVTTKTPAATPVAAAGNATTSTPAAAPPAVGVVEVPIVASTASTPAGAPTSAASPQPTPQLPPAAETVSTAVAVGVAVPSSQPAEATTSTPAATPSTPAATTATAAKPTKTCAKTTAGGSAKTPKKKAATTPKKSATTAAKKTAARVPTSDAAPVSTTTTAPPTTAAGTSVATTSTAATKTAAAKTPKTKKATATKKKKASTKTPKKSSKGKTAATTVPTAGVASPFGNCGLPEDLSSLSEEQVVAELEARGLDSRRFINPRLAGLTGYATGWRDALRAVVGLVGPAVGAVPPATPTPASTPPVPAAPAVREEPSAPPATPAASTAAPQATPMAIDSAPTAAGGAGNFTGALAPRPSAVGTVAKSCHISDIPYEVLVYMVTWCNFHDIEYRMPQVCKLFYKVANDPVAWAGVIVDACGEEEERRVLTKHSSVRMNFSCHLPLDEVVKLCPDLVAVSVDDLDECTRTGLEDIRCFNCEKYEAIHVHRDSLKSVCLWDECGPQVGPAIQACAVLTRLVVDNFFTLGFPTALPNLLSLKSSQKGLDESVWRYFTASHPGLVSITLTSCEPVTFGNTTAPLRSLTQLEVRCAQEYEDDPDPCSCEESVLAVISQCPCLEDVDLAVVTPAHFGVLAGLHRLQKLSLGTFRDQNEPDGPALRLLVDLPLHTFDVSLNKWSDDAKLAYFEVLASHGRKVSTFGKDSRFLATHPSLAAGLTELELSRMEMTDIFASYLGESCQHLRVVTLREIEAEDTIAKLAPALANVREFYTLKTDYAELLAGTVASSPFLRELVLQGHYEVETSRFMANFLRSWKGGVLERMSICSPLSRKVCLSLMDAIERGVLQAREFSAKVIWATDDEKYCNRRGEARWDEVKSKVSPCGEDLVDLEIWSRWRW